MPISSAAVSTRVPCRRHPAREQAQMRVAPHQDELPGEIGKPARGAGERAPAAVRSRICEVLFTSRPPRRTEPAIAGEEAGQDMEQRRFAGHRSARARRRARRNVY